MSTVTDAPQLANLVQLAADRPCPEWCDHAACEPVDDIDGVNRCLTATFWHSDDGDRRIEWVRSDRHELDGVVEGQGELWADAPKPGEEIEWRVGLAAASAFVYELGGSRRV